MVRFIIVVVGSLIQISLVTLQVFAQGVCASWKFIPLKSEPQQTATWCSVATVWNVTDAIYYKNTIVGSPPAQCAIVEARVKSEESAAGTSRPDTCCDDPNPQAGLPGKWRFECQMNRWPEEFLDTLQFSYRPPLVLNPDRTRPRGNFVRLAWEMATDEICDDRPYISVIGPTEDQTHAVVTHGFFHRSVTIKGREFFGIRWGGRPFADRAILVYDPFTDDSYADDWRYAKHNYLVLFGDTHFGDTYSIKRHVNN